ncbi:phage tail protein [Clostridium sartagoforme]
MKNEGYIRTKTDEFVIKSIDSSEDWLTINASLNVEDLEGEARESFTCLEETISKCLDLALAGTGWTANVTGVTKKRTVRMTNCNSWDIIQQARKTYLVEYKFDTINKIIYVKEKQGQDKGTYFTEDLNLRKIDINNDSYDFFTRIKPVGKDGLKINVNGKDYLENYQYSTKVKTLIWKDERYTVATSLLEDATIKLNELSKPRVAYKVDIIDLAKLNIKYKNILDYSLGDTIYLVSKENGIREKQRIVKIKEYPDEPERNTCEVANTILNFEDIQKEYQDAVDTVNNITSDNGTVSENAIAKAVEKLTINKVEMNKFTALEGTVGSLTVNKLNVDVANIKFAEIDTAIAKKIEVTDLTAGNIKFEVAEGGTLNLQTLLSKFITGESGQFLNITSSNVVIDNAVIKDAMIDTVSLNKVLAGDISTNRFRIVSDNGGIEIVGATQQFKDRNNKVRIQMGQDNQGNFNFILRGEDGTTTLIDHTGIKEKAITDGLIKEKMVADNAIGKDKINYTSLITGLNEGDYELIKSSKVELDETGQSLNIAFNELKTNINYDVEIISVNGNIFKNGEISTKLIAIVRKGKEDITDTIDANRFRWTRVSNDSAGDVAWNNAHFGGTKEVTITKDDVNVRATFNCEILE